MLATGFQVVSGEYTNRWVWHNINYVCGSEIAQKIGEQTIKKICTSIGVSNPDSPDELKNKPLRIHVKIKRNDYMDRLENVLSWVVEGKGKVNPTAVARVEPDSINKDDSIPF